jgi:hypothetical protein
VTLDRRPTTAGSSFRADLRGEFRRLWTPPRDDILTVVGNGLAVCAVWLVLPEELRESMFQLPGQLALAVVLASWMLGDTPATNMLAKDRDATVPLLDDAVALRRLLRAKALALTCLVGPVCAAAALVIGFYDGKYGVAIALACVLLVVPLGTAAMAGWLGIVWPYHPRSLHWRWTHRHQLRRSLRWMILILAPYVVVPALAGLLLAPAFALGASVGGRDAHGLLTGTSLAVIAAVASCTSLLVFALAPAVSSWLVGLRRQFLGEYLVDPDRG